DAVLSTGSVPLPVLNARIDQFIADGGKSPYPTRSTVTASRPDESPRHPSQAAGSHRMPSTGKFHRQLSLTDLTFIGLGAIFGSGWLFSASHVSAIAGPAGILSWLIGGAAVLLLGIVYCELG